MHQLLNKAPLLKGAILRQTSFAGNRFNKTPGGCKDPKLQDEFPIINHLIIKKNEESFYKNRGWEFIFL